jgi:ABC-type bacteriocin/lantibiotic exporter with double-glycine peptidase domain
VIADDFPDVRQFWTNDCGAACIVAVMRFFDGSADAGASIEGRDDLASAYDIVQFAHTVPLDAVGVSLDAQSLGSEDLPAILHWDGNHFVVLYETSDTGARILDPACGKCRYPWDTIREHHTGVTILFGAAARRAQAVRS